MFNTDEILWLVWIFSKRLLYPHQNLKVPFIIYALLHYYFSLLREMAKAFQFGGCCTSSYESPSQSARHPHHRLHSHAAARARQSGESVWRRGLFSCTLTAAAVEGYWCAYPRFTEAPRYRRRRSLIVTHYPSSRRRVLASRYERSFSFPWERVCIDISVSPAVPPRSPNRMWVAILLFPVFVA